MTLMQVTDNAKQGADYNNVCAALERGDINTALAITENDINKIVNGVPNSNAANIAQGNLNIAQMFKNAGEGLWDALAVSALAEESYASQHDNFDLMVQMNAAAAEEACKVVNPFGDSNTQQALYSLGQSLKLMDSAIKHVMQVQGLKGVGTDMMSKSVVNSPGLTAKATPSYEPNHSAPIGGANAYYNEVQQVLALSANTTTHTTGYL